jgi:hypothetical protein
MRVVLRAQRRADGRPERPMRASVRSHLLAKRKDRIVSRSSSRIKPSLEGRNREARWLLCGRMNPGFSRERFQRRVQLSSLGR